MTTYVVVSIVGGILFGILDGLINANPVAQRLYEVYQPIARASLNVVAGVAIDLAYGFMMAAVFLLIYTCLPGETGIVKGLSFAILVWFFRVVMSVASTWMSLVLFALIQLIPYGRSHKNPPVVQESNWDAQTRAIAKKAYFDCHSNETL
jgi:hypothetical protein